MSTREIKFRGLPMKPKIDGKNWVYGDFGSIYDEKTDYNECFVGDVEVQERTIGQYTGLKDKNGKEIYEGDILRIKRWYSDGYMEDVIRYKDGCYIWGAHEDTVDGLPFGKGGRVEVIGNIHDGLHEEARKELDL